MFCQNRKGSEDPTQTVPDRHSTNVLSYVSYKHRGSDKDFFKWLRRIKLS